MSSPMSARIAIVILAAGESSRMGQPKQLLNWGSDSVINHMIKEAKKVPYSSLNVVLGANLKSIKQQLVSGVRILENTNWKTGMGSSISVATRYLKDSCDAIQFILVDQPQVESRFLTAMLQSYSEKGNLLIATKYPGSIGIPSLFDKKYFSILAELSDTGAKSMLEKLKGELHTVTPIPFFEDMDTIAEYQHLFNQTFKRDPTAE